MRIVQGTTASTRLRHVLTQVRADYMDNVRKGKCKMDTEVLARFDAQLEKLKHGNQSVSAKR